MKIRTLLFLALMFSPVSCNMWGGLEQPETKAEKYVAALSNTDYNKCVTARDQLESITDTDDRTSRALGWTYFCLAGAQSIHIASSLYKYNSTDPDYTGIGSLARSMVPMDNTKLEFLDKAITSFLRISDSRTRTFEVALGRLVKAAGLLAKQATASGTGNLLKTSIADAGCTSVDNDCLAGCVVNSAGAMADNDVLAFAQVIGEAAVGLATSDAVDLSNLSTSLRNKVTGVAAAIGRCRIYKDLIPQ